MDNLPANTDQRIADILWHIEEAMRGTMQNASGSMLSAVRYEALSYILLGVLGCVAARVLSKRFTGDSASHRTVSVAAACAMFLFAWLALNPLGWATVYNPEIGIAGRIAHLATTHASLGIRP